MTQLELFFAILTLIGLSGSFLVYRHDHRKRRHGMIEISDIVRALGGRDKLLADIQKESEMDQLVRMGIPYAACIYFQHKLKLTISEIRAFTGFKRIPKKDSEARLSTISSDRLYRLARIYALAVNALGDEGNAVEWLKRPQWGLGGVIPFEKTKTELGAKEVENLLGRIEFSVF